MNQTTIEILTKFKNGEILSETEIKTLFAENTDSSDCAEVSHVPGFLTASQLRKALGIRHIDGSQILGDEWHNIPQNLFVRTNELRKIDKEDILDVIFNDVCSGGISFFDDMIVVNEPFAYDMIAYNVKFFDRKKILDVSKNLFNVCYSSKSTLEDIAKILDA